MHQSIPPAPTLASPPAPQVTAGHFPTLSVPGVGHLQICTARGPSICQPRGHSLAFDTHAVSYQNINYIEGFTGKKTRLVHLSKTGIRHVLDFMHAFLHCLSKLHSEIGAIDVNQRFLLIESNFC